MGTTKKNYESVWFLFNVNRVISRPTIVAIGGAIFSNSNSRKNCYRRSDVAVVVDLGYFDTYSNVYLLDFSFHIDSPEIHPDTYKKIRNNFRI